MVKIRSINLLQEVWRKVDHKLSTEKINKLLSCIREIARYYEFVKIIQDRYHTINKILGEFEQQYQGEIKAKIAKEKKGKGLNKEDNFVGEPKKVSNQELQQLNREAKLTTQLHLEI